MTQAEYIEILLIDCGIDTRKARNAYLTSIVGHEVQYLDTWHPTSAPFGLRADEKSRVIEALKDKKSSDSFGGIRSIRRL